MLAIAWIVACGVMRTVIRVVHHHHENQTHEHKRFTVREGGGGSAGFETLLQVQGLLSLGSVLGLVKNQQG